MALSKQERKEMARKAMEKRGSKKPDGSGFAKIDAYILKRQRCVNTTVSFLLSIILFFFTKFRETIHSLFNLLNTCSITKAKISFPTFTKV